MRWGGGKKIFLHHHGESSSMLAYLFWWWIQITVNHCTVWDFWTLFLAALLWSPEGSAQEVSSERGHLMCTMNEKLVANLLFSVTSIVIACSTFHQSSWGALWNQLSFAYWWWNWIVEPGLPNYIANSSGSEFRAEFLISFTDSYWTPFSDVIFSQSLSKNSSGSLCNYIWIYI